MITERDMPDDETLERLRAQMRAAGFHFLSIELAVANTMLDLVATSADIDARSRRRREAGLARDEVAKGLARQSLLQFSVAQRAELESGLSTLTVRMETTDRLASEPPHCR